MKRFILLAICVTCLGLAVVPAYAEMSGSAQSTVLVTVNPNIAVRANASAVNVGSIQRGMFWADVSFRIDANEEAINMFVEASDLWKGSDPAGTEVAPIPVMSSMAVAITPQYGNEMDAGDNAANWEGTGEAIGSFPTSKTETVTFESSQDGHYSQDVSYRIFYNQDDNEKPQGEYGGKVRLTVLL